MPNTVGITMGVLPPGPESGPLPPELLWVALKNHSKPQRVGGTGGRQAH
jgi:hypothetical protein